MKQLLVLAALAALAAAAHATNVDVSVNVGQPGYYGSIDIGNFPQPQLVYAEPVVIQQVPAGVVRQPVYLHVPPGHAKDWRKHCRKYNACAQPVYFVQEKWYKNEYAPRYRELERDGKGHGKNQGKGKGHKENRGKTEGKLREN